MPYRLNAQVGHLVPVTVQKCTNSLAYKSNFAGHVIITTKLRRMHFLRPGFFLKWNSSLKQVDFEQGFDMEQHSGTGCAFSE